MVDKNMAFGLLLGIISFTEIVSIIEKKDDTTQTNVANNKKTG